MLRNTRQVKSHATENRYILVKMNPKADIKAKSHVLRSWVILRSESIPEESMYASPRTPSELPDDLFSKIKIRVRSKPFEAVSRYNIVEVLGEGASGRVYKVLDKKRRMFHAVKIVEKKHLSKVGEVRLRREYGIMSFLKHENIIRLLRVVETPTQICLFMELGEIDFLTLLEEGTPNLRFEERSSKRYFAQIVRGVLHMHAAGYVHRDLKLENILVCNDRNSGRLVLKLADFGCATHWKKGVLHDQSLGTLNYAAPEVLDSKGLYEGPEVDVWSLGVALYVMHAGQFPFWRTTPARTRRAVISGLFGMKDHFSPDLKNLISCMLDTNQETRISLREVLKHPWMTEESAKGEQNKNSNDD